MICVFPFNVATVIYFPHLTTTSHIFSLHPTWNYFWIRIVTARPKSFPFSIYTQTAFLYTVPQSITKKAQYTHSKKAGNIPNIYADVCFPIWMNAVSRKLEPSLSADGCPGAYVNLWIHLRLSKSTSESTFRRGSVQDRHQARKVQGLIFTGRWKRER